MGSQPIRMQLRKILREIFVGNSCRKILWEILVEKSCGKWRRGKSQFKKGSDWWKFSIWNRVMGSQPIRMQLGKILWENLAGNFCRKLLREIIVGKSCGKFLWENLPGKCCGKFLREIVVGKSCRKILWENLVGKSCGKFLREFLRENLAGNGGGEKANLRKAVIGGNLAFGIG